VDWPGVLKLAAPTAERMGLKDRVEFRPGDIFKDDLGADYDLVLAVNIYHHFSPAQCLELSRRLYAAAAPGAALLLVDMVPDEKRERNRFALMFALTMLVWTREGDTYTLSEYERMLTAAGFRNLVLTELAGPPPMQAIEARK
ncbi:MAG: methyltransferase, partial [Pseudomonadota bacterium]